MSAFIFLLISPNGKNWERCCHPYGAFYAVAAILRIHGVYTDPRPHAAQTITVPKTRGFRQVRMVGADGLEPPTLSV
jgi:hypothetical protein